MYIPCPAHTLIARTIRVTAHVKVGKNTVTTSPLDTLVGVVAAIRPACPDEDVALLASRADVRKLLPDTDFLWALRENVAVACQSSNAAEYGSSDNSQAGFTACATSALLA